MVWRRAQVKNRFSIFQTKTFILQILETYWFNRNKQKRKKDQQLATCKEAKRKADSETPNHKLYQDIAKLRLVQQDHELAIRQKDAELQQSRATQQEQTDIIRDQHAELEQLGRERDALRAQYLELKAKCEQLERRVADDERQSQRLVDSLLAEYERSLANWQESNHELARSNALLEKERAANLANEKANFERRKEECRRRNSQL